MFFPVKTLILSMQIYLYFPVLLTHINHAAAQTDNSYWDEHIAILDIRIRWVSSTAYVREIVLKDFEQSEPLPKDFGFGADGFADTGLGFDLKAGDEVYTSERCYPQTPRHYSNVPGTTKSVLGKIIIDSGFKHIGQLTKLLECPKQVSDSFGPPVILTCNVKKCNCYHDCVCFACEWGSNNWCLDWCDCQIDPALHW